MTYTAHIAANIHTPAHETVQADTIGNAVKKIKLKNPEWRDCCIWVTTDCGYHETVYEAGKLIRLTNHKGGLQC